MCWEEVSEAVWRSDKYVVWGTVKSNFNLLSDFIVYQWETPFNSLILSQLSLYIISPLHSLCSPLQYQAWWKDRYGKNSFNDDEEVKTLLTQKSNGSSSGISTSITPALGTRGTWKTFIKSHPFWTQAAEDGGLLLGPLKSLIPDQLFANAFVLIVNPAVKNYSRKRLFFFF